MIYGYCRISTPKQNIERQIRNIQRNYPEAVIVAEVYTGTVVTTRPKWQKLIKGVQTGDTIVFDSVSRMSRNAEEGFKIYKELYNRDINLIFLKEPYVNTETFKNTETRSQLMIQVNTGDSAADTLVNSIIKALNKYVMELAERQIQIAFDQSEKEVLDIRQRTKEGLVIAKLQGKTLGRSKGDKLVTKKSIRTKLEMLQKIKTFGGYLKDVEAIEVLKVSRQSYFKYKAELKAEFSGGKTKEELIEQYKEMKAKTEKKKDTKVEN